MIEVHQMRPGIKRVHALGRQIGISLLHSNWQSCCDSDGLNFRANWGQAQLGTGECNPSSLFSTWDDEEIEDFCLDIWTGGFSTF
jgi:hypothetical protein